jgi:hypothetical protein
MNDARLTRRERRRLERLARKQYLRQPYLQRQLAAIAADPSLATRGRLAGGFCECDPIISFETLPPAAEAMA